MIQELSCEFQFLIGTLKTILTDLANTLEAKFQFLIGTLKTHLLAPLAFSHRKVSIPHRYAKNPSHHFTFLQYMRFQFLIGTLKTGREAGILVHQIQFQFLIGTLKT